MSKSLPSREIGGDRGQPPNYAILAPMARKARLVAPGIPHHVTQRGNNRQNVFLSDDDRRFYLDTLRRPGLNPRPWQLRLNARSVVAFCRLIF